MTSYSRATGGTWRNSVIQARNCVALAEIVNLPSEFQSSHPFFVVQHTQWIVWQVYQVKTQKCTLILTLRQSVSLGECSC